MGASAGLIMAGSTAASAVSESESLRAQGSYQRTIGNLNASIANRQAEESIEVGRSAAAESHRKTSKTVGSQRAALAASGLDINDGSAADLVESTKEIGAVEEMNIRTNAWRQAWGYRTEAINAAAEGDMKNIAARGAANQTLIAGGMHAAGHAIKGYNLINDKKPGRIDTSRGSSRRRNYGAD